MVLLLGILVGILLTLGGSIFVYIKLRDKCDKELDAVKKDAADQLSHRKSAEIRLGKVAENLSPFLKHWPYDPRTVRFIGDPIDVLVLSDDAVVFVEIKTGNSRYSQSQKKIKQLISEGKVYFESFRINEHGTYLRREGRACFGEFLKKDDNGKFIVEDLK